MSGGTCPGGGDCLDTYDTDNIGVADTSVSKIRTSKLRAKSMGAVLDSMYTSVSYTVTLEIKRHV